jgi:hypothetical protein
MRTSRWLALVVACISAALACAPASTPPAASPVATTAASTAATAPPEHNAALESPDAQAVTLAAPAPAGSDAGLVENASPSSCDPPPPAASERLVLERGACHGSCPVYKVEVRRSGTVIYEGDSWVRVRGKVCANIPKSTAAALFDEASRARISALKRSYRVPITDNPSAIVTVELAGAAPVTIEDYPPCHTEDPRTPPALCKLEASIDRAADTPRWIACRAPDGGQADCPP